MMSETRKAATQRRPRSRAASPDRLRDPGSTAAIAVSAAIDGGKGTISVTRWERRREATDDGVIEWFENPDFGVQRRRKPQYVDLGGVGLTDLTRCARIEFRGNWISRDPAQPFAARLHFDLDGYEVEEFGGVHARRLLGMLVEWHVDGDAASR